jgi:uncharacterized membrane protein YgcG
MLLVLFFIEIAFSSFIQYNLRTFKVSFGPCLVLARALETQHSITCGTQYDRIVDDNSRLPVSPPSPRGIAKGKSRQVSSNAAPKTAKKRGFSEDKDRSTGSGGESSEGTDGKESSSGSFSSGGSSTFLLFQIYLCCLHEILDSHRPGRPPQGATFDSLAKAQICFSNALT